MISRYFISINFAAFITFGLFLAMTFLISTDDNVYQERGKRIKIILPEVRPVQEPLRDFQKPEPQVIEKEPVMVTVATGAPGNVDPTVDLTPRDIDRSIKRPGNAIATNNDFITIVKPTPVYPPTLLEKGIEGYVVVRFTITETGSTENVVITQSSHKGFERSALKAAQKFKFMPRKEEGEAVAVPNVFNKIEFKLAS